MTRICCMRKKNLFSKEKNDKIKERILMLLGIDYSSILIPG